jgi:hypothetical protein
MRAKLLLRQLFSHDVFDMTWTSERSLLWVLLIGPPPLSHLGQPSFGQPYQQGSIVWADRMLLNKRHASKRSVILIFYNIRPSLI